jgi:hypothetical protein
LHLIFFSLFLRNYWSRSDPDLPESVFKGQVLTVSIVITFLAVFLLREWIFQNAGPGHNQEVENGRVPRPEEFRPNMRAMWRRRQTQNLDQDEPADVMLAPQFVPLIDHEAVRNQGMAEHNPPAVDEAGHNHNEDDQWVDEEEWVEDDVNAQDHPSDKATDEGRDDSIIMHGGESEDFGRNGAQETHIHDGSAQEEGPVPSLLQQLRRQHREHGDPNMSFEEFLLYQRHNMMERPNVEEIMNHDAATLRAMPQLQPEQPEQTHQRMHEEYMRMFADPNDSEEFRRELMLDFPHLPEDQREEQRRQRQEQVRRALRLAELEDRELERLGRLPPNRDFARELAVVPAAEAEGGEEVEMGPEPGFDDDDADDEGGLIIDGDIDGILEGKFESRSAYKAHSLILFTIILAIGLRGPITGLFQNVSNYINLHPGLRRAYCRHRLCVVPSDLYRAQLRYMRSGQCPFHHRQSAFVGKH